MPHLLAMLLLLSGTPAYDQYPVYKGQDLGLTYTPQYTRFRIWSPPANQAQLLLYKDAQSSQPFKVIDLDKTNQGTWSTKLSGNWKGTLYTFRVKIGNTWGQDVPDPYAKAVAINGKRAMIIDPKDTDPPGWTSDKSPAFSTTNRPTDAIIYELHIRDATIHPSSGTLHPGTFSGLAQTETHSPQGLPTGLDHLKELGVTHIHLLPFFDYNSVDESRPDSLQYNWGYDPLNYNAPEGSYSTNPYDGITRIKELKQLIATLHQHGLRIVMDVVYNHTALTGTSNFNQLVPGYYYRHNADNSFSNATACGNETASERPMMRKFILESVLYWAREYHIDGFRFDLMGVHDIQTMNSIADSLYKFRPDILLYGEGWTAGNSPLPDSARALKKNVSRLHHIAVFSDDIRDAIKGNVFDIHDKGFASGKPGMEAAVKFGIVASCPHPQLTTPQPTAPQPTASQPTAPQQNAAPPTTGPIPYATAPGQIITYCECHDNNTLWDKLALSCPDANPATRAKMHRLALTIVLTSQGIPFLHAGSEFLRSKQGVENSYNAGDSINALDWRLKKKNNDLVKYVESLIHMRRAHPAFRMTTATQIARNIRFDGTAPAGTIAYTINGTALRDNWKKIFIAFNGTETTQAISLPAGQWYNALDPGQPPSPQNPTPTGREIHLEGYSAVILYQQ